MLTRQLLLSAVAVVAAVPTTRGANFEVDPSHTSVVFSVSHLGYSYTYGMFRDVKGTVEFDKASPEASKFSFTIDAASLNTMNEKRDEHLKGADFFNVKQFPQITFESTAVAPAASSDGKTLYNVTGKMTMHGVEKEVTLPIELLGEGETPFNDYRAGFMCQTTLKRSDFDMDFMVGPIGDSIGVTVSFEAVKK
ncbi:YceI family protein [Botrimarina mediterranea]|uniref:Lipid/polyisoprenoid-binding YceI-like domain-containing protein n=1 Tax=Botrimarina mediterranea TaxID=2528022 RepID=A0A518K306_9BACT|nr:YceI family protein [Botrimarina mediterranea]QDV72188.1 hypothetical protein Spa11_03600 [Botrimarina mediterranea]QDV76731.1 hypothetical protein K2D_03120 [Planctomycetes bacterium K2D]